jgi:hypothetical protein
VVGRYTVQGELEDAVPVILKILFLACSVVKIKLPVADRVAEKETKLAENAGAGGKNGVIGVPMMHLR